MKTRCLLLAVAVAAALFALPFQADALPPSCWESCSCFSNCWQWCSVGATISTCGEEYICKDYCRSTGVSLGQDALNTPQEGELFAGDAAASFSDGCRTGETGAAVTDTAVADAARPALGRID